MENIYGQPQECIQIPYPLQQAAIEANLGGPDAKQLGFDVFGDPDISDEAEAALGTNTLTKRMFRREGNSPSLFGVMVSSLNIIQDRLTRSRLAGDPPDVHIKPRIGHIGLLEFERAEDLIKEGETAVERKLPELMSAVEILLLKSRSKGDR